MIQIIDWLNFITIKFSLNWNTENKKLYKKQMSEI